MIPLYSEQDFQNAKSRDKLPLKCEGCFGTFFKTKHNIQGFLNPKSKNKGEFCSNHCQLSHRHSHGKSREKFKCSQCDQDFTREPSGAKSKNHFCSRSCAAKWHNAHKKYGTRRSKLEKWLEEQLIQLYPELDLHFNRKDAINSELDIYIPSLKLAFELNGIFHYEPIYGPEKLASVQNNDKRKFAACQESSIALCIIDVSQHKYVKPKTSKKYLDIICSIVEERLLEVLPHQ